MTSKSARISVIVVSFGRARSLLRSLKAIHQLRGQAVELIVVADPDGLDVARGLPFAGRIKFCAQDSPNISVARNTGLAQAAGGIVAFIDDDAVPEPDWANAISAAITDGADAVTGPVIGRNGISLQWDRMALSCLGQDRALSGETEQPEDSEALKLQGTSMAFRRSVFDRIGGFDPAFRFYLDDADMAFRISLAGLTARFDPAMVVHHGFAASSRRREDRVPLDLFDIGASTSVFLGKYAETKDVAGAVSALEQAQRARLLRLARQRKIGARTLGSLMESLINGLAAGRGRTSEHPQIPAAGDAFLGVTEREVPDMQVLAGWRHQAPRLRAAAAENVETGQPSLLFLFEPTPRKHRLQFTDGGWWEQTGGLYGPSTRDTARLQFWRFSDRVRSESHRLRRILLNPK